MKISEHPFGKVISVVAFFVLLGQRPGLTVPCPFKLMCNQLISVDSFFKL